MWMCPLEERLPTSITPVHQGFQRPHTDKMYFCDLCAVSCDVDLDDTGKSQVLCHGFRNMCWPQRNGGCHHPITLQALQPLHLQPPLWECKCPAHCARLFSGNSYLFHIHSLTHSCSQAIHFVQPVPFFSPPYLGKSQQLPPCFPLIFVF